MAFTTIPSAGQRVRGSVLSALITELRPITAAKASSTSRNTTITMTADPELFVALLANAVYDFEVVGYGSSAANAAGGLKMDLAFPAAATLSAMNLGLVSTLAGGNSADVDAFGQPMDAASPTAAWVVGLSTITTGFRLAGRITVGATAGNLTYEWAQFSSNANNSTLLAGSTLTARRVN